MKNHFWILLIAGIGAFAFYLFYEQYQADLARIHQDKDQLSVQNTILADQLGIMNQKLDSLNALVEEIQPVDIAEISDFLKASVFKIVVFKSRQHPDNESDLEDDTESQESQSLEVFAGTGFAVFEGDILMTNYHVIGDDAVFVLAIDHQGREVPVRKALILDKKLDYALLSAPGLGATPLYASESTIKEGIQVITMGNPLDMDFTPSVGWVTAMRLQNNVLQLNAPITFGSSGGPVIDKYGQLLGMVYGGMESNAMLNFAVNIHSIMYDIEQKTNIKIMRNLLAPASIFESVYSLTPEHRGRHPLPVSLASEFISAIPTLTKLEYGKYAQPQSVDH